MSFNFDITIDFKKDIKEKKGGKEFIEKLESMSKKERKEFMAKFVSAAIAMKIIYDFLIGDKK